MKKENIENAKIFIDAIRTFAEKPQNLENFQSYLENHFGIWLEKFANTPQGIAGEMKSFAEMEI